MWKLYNAVYAWWYKRKGTGALPDKKDPRDHWWASTLGYSPKHKELDWAGDGVGEQWRFSQQPINICVFASAVLAASWQNGVRMSVRWFVKLALREGMVSGDGFSYLRAAKKIAKKYGYLPYYYMPDEIDTSWYEYSHWTPEDEKLLEIAADFKTNDYSRIRTTDQAREALDAGYVLCTASKWYAQTMNWPTPPSYVLLAKSGYIGGHAYPVTGYRDNVFIVTNSFGRSYGNDGQAIDNGLSEAHDYAIWLESFLPAGPLAEHVLKEQDFNIVKGSGPALYLLEGGKKRPFMTAESYTLWRAKEARDPEIVHLRDFVLNSIPLGKEMDLI